VLFRSERAGLFPVSFSHQCSPGSVCVFYILLCFLFLFWLRNALCSVPLNRRRNFMYTCSIQAVCNSCCSLYVRQPGAYFWLFIALLDIGPWVYLLGSTLRKPTSFVDYLWSTKLCGRYLSPIHIRI
jgi:hypothetical protein